MTHGVLIGLCVVHRTLGYLRRRGGAVFVHRVAEVWASNGMLTERRRSALLGHLRRVRETLRAGDLPGSYAWRPQRVHAEARFAAGDSRDAVIADMRDAARWGPGRPPSRRTILRWLAEARWLKPPAPAIDPTLDAVARGVAAVLEIFRNPNEFWRCDDPGSKEMRRMIALTRRDE